MKKKLGLNKKAFFPVSMPNVTPKDIISVNKALKTGWISSEGPEVKKFEKNFSKYINRKYAVAVSSGTAALEIAIKALNLKKGDEVIIPSYTFTSTANCIIMRGAKPVFVDINSHDLNMSAEEIEKNITKKTKAIILVHYAGVSCDLEKIIRKEVKRNNLIATLDINKAINKTSVLLLWYFILSVMLIYPFRR